MKFFERIYLFYLPLMSEDAVTERFTNFLKLLEKVNLKVFLKKLTS